MESNGSLSINVILDTDLKRAARWHPGGIEEWTSLEWTACMAGEAGEAVAAFMEMLKHSGEACNSAKKLRRLDSGLKSINDLDRHFEYPAEARHAVVKEIADTIIYGLLAAARIGVTDMESVIREVFNKKSEEYGFPERI